MQTNKIYILVIGLFYPAILGSIIFNFIDKFKIEEISFEYFLFILILTVYSFDYLYTAMDDVKEGYTTLHGIFDIVIILLLFFATRFLFSETLSTYVPLIFVFTKVVSLLWEFIGNKDKFAKMIHCIFIVLYLFLYLCFFSYLTLLLYLFSFILVIDIIVSWKYDKIKSSF